MNQRFARWFLIGFCFLALPFSSPAPLTYQPGEGWSYEPVGGGGKWRFVRANEQLEHAQKAFDQKDYSLALKSARRVVKVWPLSDYAPRAQYLIGRCYESKHKDQKAFEQYQIIFEKNPKIDNYDELLKRQYEIAGRFLAGQRFRLWGVFPLFRSMDKTSEMYAKIVKNGPFSDIGPEAQLKIGNARDKQKNYPMAVKAYELAADRYHDRPVIAAEALYREGHAFNKQAQTADYDQTAAGHAISIFNDFLTLYPDDKRAPETSKIIASLKTEQARGSFMIAQFYEKRHKWAGAMAYYNESLVQDLNSPYAPQARQRIEAIQQRTKPAEKPKK